MEILAEILAHFFVVCKAGQKDKFPHLRSQSYQ